ncbi:peptidoglycan editing factor PgeF [Clostridium baratii]|uniref:peptidoglycan editing factor PgeF n=1 Tax=Clostridium baratii TaxID=1561 RepID=UPI002907297C|nr:peptidoglycan editing factor PgeF [Clostridium baratii]MDU4910540.1 peptidoglycan editing factor PgeF [Clostridium baratii]
MNIIIKESLNKKEDFLVLDNDKSKVVFSTALYNRSFNRNTDEGKEALNSIVDDFNVKKVLYLNQVHSDKVYTYKNEENFIENDGDGIITNERNVAIGVFTADCVPVIIINEVSGVIGAVHSGWKGTFNSITKIALDKMKEEYEVDHKYTKIYIGAHIRKCCYEVSEDLKTKFLEKMNIEEDILFTGRNLNLEACIEKNAIDSGVLGENIFTLNECTYCSTNIKLHSYRKSEGSYGRLFSFVILK